MKLRSCAKNDNPSDEIISISSGDEMAVDNFKSAATKTENYRNLLLVDGVSSKDKNTDSDLGQNKEKRKRKGRVLNNNNIVKISKNRIVDENQMKVTDFFSATKKPSTQESYFKTYDTSKVQNNKTIRKKKSGVLSSGNKNIVENNNTDCIVISNSIPNQSITTDAIENLNIIPNNLQTTECVTIPNIHKLKQKPKKTRGVCPSYKIVDGTKFAVDAFRYGDINGMVAYFLTHFHADHYIGLNKNFAHPLYVSEITGRLVNEFIKVDKQYIHTMPLNTEILVDNVQVIALEANHCPGAVMFLFKLCNGECILHTGDFRADPSMEEYPEFWNNQITTLYLDTTYLSKKYDFQNQSDSLEQTKFECKKFLDKYIGEKVLIVCGSYVIGKERVWMEIAQCFNMKVWLEPSRRRAVECYKNPLILKHLTADQIDAQIHVLGLGSLQYKVLAEYLSDFTDHFSHILAIRPSGWEKNSRPSYGNKISIVGIEYSEHSSYSELKRFVRFLQPKKIISTVPTSSKNVSCTSVVPQSWLNKQIKPQKIGYQASIMDFAKRSVQTSNL